MQSLDHLLRKLAVAPTDHGLTQLEPAHWRRLEAARHKKTAGNFFQPLRVATVSGALAIGVVLGGAQAVTVTSRTSEASVFSARPDLAPSTLLETSR